MTAGQEHRRYRPEIFPPQTPLGLGTGEEPQDPQGGDRLGEDGGQGRAPNAHIQAEDENGVQDRIEDSAEQHGLHADGGKALGGDVGVHARVIKTNTVPRE